MQAWVFKVMRKGQNIWKTYDCGMASLCSKMYDDFGHIIEIFWFIHEKKHIMNASARSAFIINTRKAMFMTWLPFNGERCFAALRDWT